MVSRIAGKDNIMSQALFNARVAARKQAQREADLAQPWRVYQLRKDGSLYKNPDAYCATKEAAERRAAELKRLNPGKYFLAILA
jgi:hypothetical protein